MTAVQATSDTRPTPLIAVSVETVAYLIVLIAVLVLRATSLGATPLSDLEARQALAAQHLVSPLKPGMGQIDNPVTFMGLALSLGAMGASDGSARIFPMIAGVLLVFTPLLFRDRLGRLPTLIAASLLALSPIEVGLSRMVGGYSFAALAFVIALAALDRYLRFGTQRALILIGVALGLAVMSDYTAILAAIAVGIGLLYARLSVSDTDEQPVEISEHLANIPWLTLAISFVATFFIVGSLFFLAPEGLGAAANQFGRFAQGLAQRTPGVTWAGLSLLMYEPGLVIFGLAGAWAGSQSTRTWHRFLAGWGFASLLIFLIYPGALPGHVLWIVLPFSGLAALTIANVVSMRPAAPTWVGWGHAAVVLAFFGMIFASLSQYLTTPHILAFPPNAAPGQATAQIPVDLILVGAWSLLLVVLWLMVASMWEQGVAWKGLGLGTLGLMTLISIGQAGSLAFNRASSPFEPLLIAPAQPSLNVLAKTIDEVGDLTIGNSVDPSIAVQGEASDALIWALRNQTNVTFASVADPTVQTSMVITPADGADPALGSAYVGQDFTIVRNWAPSGLSSADIVRWVLYRTAPTPTGDGKVILWVREDLYRLVPAGGSPGE